MIYISPISMIEVGGASKILTLWYRRGRSGLGLLTGLKPC